MFNKVLIANRGEIALRIIRACRELSVKTVAVYSEADKDSLHVKLADEAYCIGAAPAQKSYLNMTNILTTAKLSGADAIHPGFGFLAENPYFAEICDTNHIKFIGPTSKSIELMGNKSRAREIMLKNNIPIIPGSQGAVADEKEAVKIAGEIGYPVIIKASAGGGGRGMRVAHNENDLIKALGLAKSEAKASFGNPEVYIEKYIEEPRHIEFQILGDDYGNIVHLGERDCSLQRRHQKLLEETPSAGIDDELRVQMGQTAVDIASIIGYTNTGTVEFLLDKSGNYYFMEMNTRIQVEHGITELVTGVDLVKEQIKIAAGEKIDFSQEDVKFSGHSIECRVNAEDPEHDFRPSTGQIKTWIVPGGPGVRLDTAVYPGYVIPPYYDSLIAKLMVWGRDRQEAIIRMQRALDEFTVVGIKTTIPYHKKILSNAFFQKGEVYTNFIQRRMI